MGRTEYYNDPHAPKPNTLIPASNLIVQDADGRLLLQRRRDTGQWALPGGAQELGESPSECAIRECREETGIDAEIVGFLGIFSDPLHIVAYSDGEVRQQFEVTLIGKPVGGETTINDEASEVQWFSPSELGSLDIHLTMRRQIGRFLNSNYPHVD